MNPDGSGQMIYYGNMHPGIVMIDARPIPGTDQVLACFSPGHGVTDHQGIATLVSPAQGPDSLASIRRLHQGPLIKDPYPLSGDCFLVARNNQILVMDGDGKHSAAVSAGRVRERSTNPDRCSGGRASRSFRRRLSPRRRRASCC